MEGAVDFRQCALESGSWLWLVRSGAGSWEEEERAEEEEEDEEEDEEEEEQITWRPHP